MRVEGETVWLNRQQIASLFDRDVKTNGKRITNVLKEELAGLSVVAKFATTVKDGKSYQVEHYNLDMIISVGYRVKSQRGIQFRVWANQILKDFLLKGYSLNQRINRIEDTVYNLAAKVDAIDLNMAWRNFSLFTISKNISLYIHDIQALINLIVIQAGFEPTTRSLEGCCSIQLSYWTILALMLAMQYFLEFTYQTTAYKKRRLAPFFISLCRGGEIRTHDPLLPKQVP